MKEVTKIPPLPSRDPDAHKGTFGRVLVVGGNRDMSGAVVMAGQSALRSGTGLVFIGVPVGVQAAVAVRTTCCITRGLPETEDGSLDVSGFSRITELSEAADALVLGPGVGRHPSTADLVRRVIGSVGLPTVVDADGLNALAENAAIMKGARGRLVLTPHPGEMARLRGVSSPKEIQNNRRAIAREFAEEHRCVVLLKGRGTVVTDGERLFVNPTGNPGMATGGAGDVLSGVVAALMAQGFEPFEAAQLGAYTHGIAGDLAAQRIGQTSLIATDILDALPEAFRKLPV